MRKARDTFLHFLADNLTNLTVHNLRTDPNFPSASELAMNAINVQFITDSPKVDVSTLTVAVDTVYDHELDAVDAMTAVWTLLQIRAFTPLLDYASPFSPVDQGSILSWDSTKISFRPIHSETYSRFSCLMTLRYRLIAT